MLWVILVSGAVVIAAGFSLAASRDSRRDIDSGHPTFYSVADMTGIWNRERLDHLLGARDADDRYTVDPEVVYGIPQTWWKRLFDDDWCDLAAIFLALMAPILFRSRTVLGISLLAIAAVYVLIGYITAVVVVVRSRSWGEDEHST